MALNDERAILNDRLERDPAMSHSEFPTEASDLGEPLIGLPPELESVPAEPALAADPGCPETGSDIERFLLLMRHGIAEERTEGIEDEERVLTKKGAQRMKEIGKGLAEIFPYVDAIYTSPLVRAAQTGAYLAKGYGGKILIRMTEALEPGRPTSEFRDLLGTLPVRRLVFVGHEPDLTRILGDLCGLDTSRMELKKGACYGVRVQASGEMRLEWMLPPGVLRRINP